MLPGGGGFQTSSKTSTTISGRGSTALDPIYNSSPMQPLSFPFILYNHDAYAVPQPSTQVQFSSGGHGSCSFGGVLVPGVTQANATVTSSRSVRPEPAGVFGSTSGGGNGGSLRPLIGQLHPSATLSGTVPSQFHSPEAAGVFACTSKGGNGGSVRPGIEQLNPSTTLSGTVPTQFHSPVWQRSPAKPWILNHGHVNVPLGVQFVQWCAPSQCANEGVTANECNQLAMANTWNHQVMAQISQGHLGADPVLLQTSFNNGNNIVNGHFQNQNINGHPYHLMPPEGMTHGTGPLQDLIRNFSLGNELTRGLVSPDLSAVATPVGPLLPGIHDGNSKKANSQGSILNQEHDESGGSEGDVDDEEEYHEADDEESDDLPETTISFVPVTPMDEDAAECELQFEFYPVTVDKNGVVTKRRRFPKGYEVPDYRPARDVGAIEKAMRIGRTSPTGHIFEPKIGMVFDSRIEAYKFYNLFSWEVGFGVRFGSFAQNRVNKMRTMQKIVCERQGFDSRAQSKSKRCRCKAMIILHRTEDMGWYVSKHVTDHNHDLSLTCGEKREWNSHSKIEPPVRNMIRYLRESNISLTRVHIFLGKMFGGMKNVPFNHKSLRSVCSEIARDQKDDDMAKTLALFHQMREEDLGFQFSVDADSENKVKTLIWASGRARSQYAYFGDAITFDTTYCTNIYNMPFGMFVGVNNHFQSILFAGVFMKNEDAKSFNWVFTEFLTLMGGKAPVTILTDQCKAMTKAIREVFTDTTHFWCKWHVLRDAPQELGPLFRKNLEFQQEFNFVINQMLTIDEFERGWHDLVKRYGLEENEFMERTYAKREKWAKPWAKGIFCARMASTQRSESANNMLKKYVPPNSCMNRFVEQYRTFEFQRTAAEHKAEHQTKQFVHRTKRMYPIEKHALNVYTKNCFGLFSEEADKSANYLVKEASNDSYFVIHNRPEVRKGWARVEFFVKVEENGKRYSCECGQYEHFGILCCHAIKVMIHKGLREIPEAHIMKRWTRKARDFVYPDPENQSTGPALGQNLIFANALDVVKSTEGNPMAEKILMQHLNNAKKEIAVANAADGKMMMMTDGESTPWEGYMDVSETDGGDAMGYESTAQIPGGNTYGASGCSAYMSDADIRNIQAPKIPPSNGRKREKRFKRVFERKKKGWKKYKAISEVVEPVKKIQKPKKASRKKAHLVEY